MIWTNTARKKKEKTQALVNESQWRFVHASPLNFTVQKRKKKSMFGNKDNALKVLQVGEKMFTYNNIHQCLWVRKIIWRCGDYMRWVNALVDISWGYPNVLFFFPFLQQNGFSFQTTKSKRTISTNLNPARLFTARSSAVSQSRSKKGGEEASTPLCSRLEISRDTQCKTSSVVGSRRKPDTEKEIDR